MPKGIQSTCADLWAAIRDARADALIVVALALISQIARLVVVGPKLFMPPAALIVVAVFVYARMAIWKDAPRQIMRWVPIFMVCLVYADLDQDHGITHLIMSTFGIAPKDGLMLRIDQFICFGSTPAQWFDTPLLSGPTASALWSTWYVVGFFPMIAVSLGVIYLRGTKEAFYRARAKVIFLFLAGYVLYGLVPVTGPIRFEPVAHTFVHKANIQDFFKTAAASYDCFPSLHTAGSILFVWIMWPHLSNGWRMAASFNAAMVILTTITTRSHYLVDVVAGVAYAMILVRTCDHLLDRAYARRLAHEAPIKVAIPGLSEA